MRVLVVDDDALVRRLMADCLLEAGHQVHEAENAEDAMTSVERKHTFELVVTDVKMPGAIDGFAFSKWVKMRSPAVKVLVVSGYADQEAGSVQYYDAFLGKPFTAGSLNRAINEIAAC